MTNGCVDVRAFYIDTYAYVYKCIHCIYFVYIYIYIHIGADVNTLLIHMFMYTNVYICIYYVYIYIHTYRCGCKHTFEHKYVCTYVCMYVCMDVCMDECMCTYLSLYMSISLMLDMSMCICRTGKSSVEGGCESTFLTRLFLAPGQWIPGGPIPLPKKGKIVVCGSVTINNGSVMYVVYVTCMYVCIYIYMYYICIAHIGLHIHQRGLTVSYPMTSSSQVCKRKASQAWSDKNVRPQARKLVEGLGFREP